MLARRARYTKDDHARLGEALYANAVRAQVEPENGGKVVAIDVDSGDFEVAADSLAASTQLLARRPDAQIWCVRIGHSTVYRFGILPASSHT